MTMLNMQFKHQQAQAEHIPTAEDSARDAQAAQHASMYSTLTLSNNLQRSDTTSEAWPH